MLAQAPMVLRGQGARFVIPTSLVILNTGEAGVRDRTYVSSVGAECGNATGACVFAIPVDCIASP
jgi:hypothetical protein